MTFGLSSDKFEAKRKIPREVALKHGPTNTIQLKELKASLQLSNLQHEVVIGTILGDGCLISSRSGKAARLQIRHQLKHQEYVEWKYQVFSNWVITLPRYDRFNNSIVFRTICHPDLMAIRQLFYRPNGIKIVPKDIEKLLITPLSLAIWYMDDGTCYLTNISYKLCSYGFGKEGNILLQECLRKNFNLQSVIAYDGKGFYLRFPKDSALRFYEIVKPYVVNCMQYKLRNVNPVETDP